MCVFHIKYEKVFCPKLDKVEKINSIQKNKIDILNIILNLNYIYQFFV